MTDRRRPQPLPTGAPALLCTLLVLSLGGGTGCAPEVDLELLLIDECDAATSFQQALSIRVTLADEVAFNADSELSGCQRRSLCLTQGEDYESIDDFSALRQLLLERSPLFQTLPGVGRGVVVTGFRARGCVPTTGVQQPVVFCGYQVMSVPSADSRFYLLLSCQPGEVANICWDSQFLAPCG